MNTTRRSFLGMLATAGAGLWAIRCRRPPDPPAGFDVCVIGSGPAGALVAVRLVERGHRVLVVESGPAYGGSRDERSQRLEAYRSVGRVPYRPGATFARVAGGTSQMWTGHCPRFQPRDFELTSPIAGRWPVDYATMEPHYLAAEEELRVQGTAASPGAPPRSAPYPVAPDPRRHLGPLEEILAPMGLVVDYLPLAVWETGPPRIAETHLPRVAEEALGTLLLDHTATRVHTDAAGAVTGIEIRDLDGVVSVVSARAYVLAANGIETPRLLLLSRGDAFPEGVGNQRGLVGWPFMEHLVVAGTGLLPDRSLPGPRYLGSAISYSFLEPTRAAGLGETMVKLYLAPEPSKGRQQAQLTLQAELEMEPSPGNRVSLEPAVRDLFGDAGARIDLSATPRDMATIRHARKIVRDVLTRAGCRDVAVGNEVSWASHHMGTCRMGPDPATSVVDGDLLVRGTTNLYLSGSGTFVHGGAASPTLTIAAFSLRLADHLDRQLATHH